ncbi:MAG: hypothetical protein HN725_19660 [Alphaproteobacteria bacterium]|jgi:hypothetical protein|nr:hypothetical protein [Alphaproteobacteria bacterium]MBT4083545.1 hypothetical protein [Alphaproteobacteria bacterium]MBT4546682.1 hypothetical protein [Alphaproteobacteria bacterium]MBT7747513.1 hypothetical protein [Alphaproteobacteria bacterium]
MLNGRTTPHASSKLRPGTKADTSVDISPALHDLVRLLADVATEDVANNEDHSDRDEPDQ